MQGIERVRLTAVEAALSDLERALVRDRCHAVLCTGPGANVEPLLQALAARLAGSLRVLTLPAGTDADALSASLLAELEEPSGLEPEAALIAVAKRLSAQGSALVLIARDARALPLATLRRLGRLAVLSRPGLRLVLCGTLDAGAQRDTAAEIMVPVGVGAVKVVLGAHERAQPLRAPSRSAPIVAPAPPAPERSHEPAFPAIRAIRSLGARRLLAGRAGRRTAAALALALGIAALYRLDEPAVEAEAAPLALAAAAPAATAPAPKLDPEPDPEPAPQPAPAPPSPPRAPAPAPERAPAVVAMPVSYTPVPAAQAPPPAEPEPVVAEATPEPVEELIRISVNADPWARIQVDGRDVGVTPMSDLQLAPGAHRFRVRFPDGRVIERSVHVDALRDHIRFP